MAVAIPQPEWAAGWAACTKIVQMNDVEKASRKARLFLAWALLLGSCSKHDLQYPTLWLRVDVARPRADDFVRIGSSEERYEVKIGDRWQKLGIGHHSGYTILGEEAITAPAAVVNLDNPRGKVLVRPEGPPLWLDGAVYFPDGMSFDVMKGTDREAEIDRYDATGRQTGSVSVSVPNAYSDCRINGIRGYSGGIPYIDTICSASSSQARCLLIAAGKEQVLHAVKPDQPAGDCAFPQLHLSHPSPRYRHF